MGNNFTEKKRSPGSCDGVNIKGILSFARKPCCEHLAAHNSLFVRSSQRNPFGSFGGGLQRGQSPFLQGVFSGEAPLWAEKAGARLECSGLLCGEESKETWVSWRGYPKGAGPPLAHDLACKVLLCDLLMLHQIQNPLPGAAGKIGFVHADPALLCFSEYIIAKELYRFWDT